jgi:anti-sigma regulatory factor (Ser/Thr protein kinase)
MRQRFYICGKILTAAPPGGHSRMTDRRRLDTVLASRRSEIPRLAGIVRQFGTDNHLSDDDIMRIRLVLDEIVVNIVAHGYEDAGDTNRHDIHVHLCLDDRDVLTIRVTDDAREYDPRLAPAPRFDLPIEERRKGGLGVHIVKAIMDTIDYRRVDGQNVLTLTKKLGM